MSQGKKDPSIDEAAMKALVTVYGPREAARIAKLPVGTMQSWCFRRQWKKGDVKKVEGGGGITGKDAGDTLALAMQESKKQSTLHLAKYTEKASKQAAKAKNPLEIARKVKDVASVYSTLWPQESHSELIEGAILVGKAAVTDDIEEVKCLAASSET